MHLGPADPAIADTPPNAEDQRPAARRVRCLSSFG